MLKIRKSGGETIDVEDGFAVEICDTEGKPAVVAYLDGSGVVRLIQAGDPEVARYEKLFNTSFVEVRDASKMVPN